MADIVVNNSAGWDYPIQEGSILTIPQVRSTILSLRVLSLDAGYPTNIPKLEYPAIKLGAPGVTIYDKSLLDEHGEYIPCKASFSTGFNQLKFTYRCTESLNAIYAYVTDISEEYGLGKGTLAFVNTGSIAANENHLLTVDINTTNFIHGDSTYIVAIYARAQGSDIWTVTLFVVSFGRLPEGYTELEYISSDGSAYINTNLSQGNIVFECDMLFANSSNRVLIGYGINATNYFGSDANNHPELGGGVCIPEVNATQRHVYKYWYENNVGGHLETEGYSILRPAGSAPVTPFLTRVAGYTGQHTLYRIRVFDSNIVIRDFIPAKNPSNQIGMFDTVTQQFFGNSGTGAFIAGPDIAPKTGIYTSNKEELHVPRIGEINNL